MVLQVGGGLPGVTGAPLLVSPWQGWPGKAQQLHGSPGRPSHTQTGTFGVSCKQQGELSPGPSNLFNWMHIRITQRF